MIMAVIMLQPRLSLHIFFAFLISALPDLSQCQYGSPQNIETFYPFEAPSPAPAPAHLPPTSPLGVSPQTAPKSSTNNKIVIAVAATAASTLVLSGLLFFLIRRCVVARRGREKDLTAPNEDRPAGQRNGSLRFDEDINGFVIDENGLDVLYGKNLHKGELSNSNPKREEEKKEVPLLRGKSSTSHLKVVPEEDNNANHEEPKPLTQQSTPPPPPPPPPIPGKKTSTPTPPPPPKAGSLGSSSKPPPAPPKGMPSDNTKPGEASSGAVKMKPLHWDKVNTNTDHSMVWDKIDRGSFRVDGELMEHLFGYVANNRLCPQINNNSRDRGSPNSDLPAQIFILEPRRSQNIAIVLKSLAISLEGILDAVTEGQGLDADTLEKLTKAAPTEEEQSQILQYDGDPTRLANAEAFLYHLLKAVPSAFTHLNAMLFRLNYDSEILQLKESIETLELGCNELRTRGLFMKLLEAILKAGNRMNAGTARGNAQAFNLNALRKLSDVKSTDGKTTLLHFVVEEVVRSEGKKCVMNRNHSFKRSSSRSSNSSSSNHESSKAKEEREKEYKMLGLPIVGGLSAEFSNVKKAATVDYDTFAGMISALTARVAEIRTLVSQCANDRGGGFAREMKGFLEEAEEELKVLGEEETRVMELVKRTTEYYQAGASKDKRAFPLQLFAIVKDFLGMVDQACVEITRTLQKQKASTTTTLGSSSPKSPPSKTAVRFPNLPEYFMSDKSRSSSSELDDL